MFVFCGLCLVYCCFALCCVRLFLIVLGCFASFDLVFLCLICSCFNLFKGFSLPKLFVFFSKCVSSFWLCQVVSHCLMLFFFRLF